MERWQKLIWILGTCGYPSTSSGSDGNPWNPGNAFAFAPAHPGLGLGLPLNRSMPSKQMRTFEFKAFGRFADYCFKSLRMGCDNRYQNYRLLRACIPETSFRSVVQCSFTRFTLGLQLRIWWRRVALPPRKSRQGPVRFVQNHPGL